MTFSVNLDYVGREYPANAPYSVGREKIREFAAAVGSTHPAHHFVDTARGLGYPDLIAPPTFAVIVAQRAEAQYIEDPAARVDFTRVVHADERFVHHRPIRAGDELVTVLTVVSITERAGLAMVTTRCDIYALDAAVPPADAAVRPADATVPPADAAVPPAGAAALSADAAVPPADATVPPADAGAAPDAVTALVTAGAELVSTVTSTLAVRGEGL